MMRTHDVQFETRPAGLFSLHLSGVFISIVALAAFGVAACSNSVDDAAASDAQEGSTADEGGSSSLGVSDPEVLWLPAGAGGAAAGSHDGPGPHPTADSDTVCFGACTLINDTDLGLLYRVVEMEDLRETTPCAERPFDGGVRFRMTVEPLAAFNPPGYELPERLEVLSTGVMQRVGALKFAKLRQVEGHWVRRPGTLLVESQAADDSFTEEDAARLAADRGIDWQLPFTVDGIRDAVADAIAAGTCGTSPGFRVSSEEELAASFRGLGARNCEREGSDAPVEGTDGADPGPGEPGDSQ